MASRLRERVNVLEALLREALLHIPEGGKDNYLPERIRAELGIGFDGEDAGPGEEDGPWAEGWEERFGTVDP